MTTRINLILGVTKNQGSTFCLKDQSKGMKNNFGNRPQIGLLCKENNLEWKDQLIKAKLKIKGC